MTSRSLPNEILWFFNATNRIFPNHLKAIWEGDVLMAVHRTATGRTADQMLGRFLSERPAAVGGPMTRVPIAMTGYPPIVARYVALDILEWDRAFLFGYVQVPQAAISEEDLASISRLSLTRREADIALQVSTGSSLTQIARDSQSSITTMRNLLKSALRKTGCGSQQELAILVHALLNRY